jgi:hypothetical protein
MNSVISIRPIEIQTATSDFLTIFIDCVRCSLLRKQFLFTCDIFYAKKQTSSNMLNSRNLKRSSGKVAYCPFIKWPTELDRIRLHHMPYCCPEILDKCFDTGEHCCIALPYIAFQILFAILCSRT